LTKAANGGVLVHCSTVSLHPSHGNEVSDTSHTSRVTRLGEFSPFGRQFTLSSFYSLKISEVAQIIWATFIPGKSYLLILAKTGWAIFWAIFSQTHLATLHTSLFFLLYSSLSMFSIHLFLASSSQVVFFYYSSLSYLYL
jgi:hypothetical protein